MHVEGLGGSLLGDQQGHLVLGGGTYLLAYEDVGQGLVVVEQSAVGVHQQQVVVQFF